MMKRAWREGVLVIFAPCSFLFSLSEEQHFSILHKIAGATWAGIRDPQLANKHAARDGFPIPKKAFAF